MGRRAKDPLLLGIVRIDLCALDDLQHTGILRLPAQFVFNSIASGDQRRRITRSPIQRWRVFSGMYASRLYSFASRLPPIAAEAVRDFV